MKLQSEFKISVGFGACSINVPSPKVLPIDYRTQFYSRETILFKFNLKIPSEIMSQKDEVKSF